jgi:hypothetical protein
VLQYMLLTMLLLIQNRKQGAGDRHTFATNLPLTWGCAAAAAAG